MITIISLRKEKEQIMKNNNEDFSPYYDEETERMILGTALLGNETFNFVFFKYHLLEEDFYLLKHRLIYKEIMSIFDSLNIPDTISVIKGLREKGHLESAGGEKYILSLLGDYQSISHIEIYFELLKDYSLKRSTLRIAEQIRSDISQDINIHKILEKIQMAIFNLTSEKYPPCYKAIRDVLSRTLDDIDKARNTKTAVCGISTGFSTLDNITQGFQPSDYIVIFGGTDIRSLALSMTVNISRNHKMPVAYFSLAKSDTMLMKGMLAMDAEVNFAKLSTGYLTAEDFRRILESAERMDEFPLYFIDKPNMSIFDIYAESARLKQSHNIEIIIIDNFNLIHTDKKRSTISKYIRYFARMLNIPIVVLYELDSAINAFDPVLFTTGILGKIKSDADTVFVLKRKGAAKAKLSIAKNKNGPVGCIDLDYNPLLFKFKETKGISPDDAESHFNRGLTYYNNNDFDSAIAEYSEGIKHDPNHASAFLIRGSAYFHKGDFDSAVADYSETIRLDPDCAYAYTNRGSAYNKKNDYEHALADHNEAIKINPKLISAYNNRGSLYYDNDKYDLALVDFNEAIHIDPLYSLAYFNLGLTYNKKSDFDCAITNWNEGLKLDPNDANAYYNRGLAYQAIGDADKANADFAKAKELGYSPDSDIQ